MEILDQILEMISGPLISIVLVWIYLRWCQSIDVGPIESRPGLEWLEGVGSELEQDDSGGDGVSFDVGSIFDGFDGSDC